MIPMINKWYSNFIGKTVQPLNWCLQDVRSISGAVGMKITDKSQPDQTWDQKNPESEQLLRASEQHYQTLARISPVGIFHTDPNGFTRYVNPKWCAISGFSPEQALGDGWLEAVHPDDREKLRAGWRESTQLQRTSFSDYRFIRPDGSIIWVMGRHLMTRVPIVTWSNRSHSKGFCTLYGRSMVSGFR